MKDRSIFKLRRNRYDGTIWGSCLESIITQWKHGLRSSVLFIKKATMPFSVLSLQQRTCTSMSEFFLLTLMHSEEPKLLWSFGHSECNMVKGRSLSRAVKHPGKKTESHKSTAPLKTWQTKCSILYKKFLWAIFFHIEKKKKWKETKKKTEMFQYFGHLDLKYQFVYLFCQVCTFALLYYKTK